MPFGGWPVRNAWVWPPSGRTPWIWPPGNARGAPPLPAATVDYLIANGPNPKITFDGSRNVQTWTSALNVFAPTQAVVAQRPTYGLDGAYFNGRPVVMCQNVGNRWLNSPAAGIIFANGSRPYTCGYIRIRAYQAGLNGVWAFSNAPGATNSPGLYTNLVTTAVFCNPIGSISPATFAPTVPVFVEAFVDSASGSIVLAANLVTLATSGPTGTINVDAVRMGVGANVGGGNHTDSSFDFLLAAASTPTLTERTRLYNWCRS